MTTTLDKKLDSLLREQELRQALSAAIRTARWGDVVQYERELHSLAQAKR